MTKAQARQTLLNAGASDEDKIEARKTLGLPEDGSRDSTVTGTDSTDTKGATETQQKVNAANTQAPASAGATDSTQPPASDSAISSTASNTTADTTAAPTARDSFPNTGESADLNRPAVLDTGAAAANAQTANAQRFRNDRPNFEPRPSVIRRQGMTGEVDSATTVTGADSTAPANAAHPTQRFVDNRGYSNYREVVAPAVMPTVNVPVSNMVHYVGEDGTVLGSVERGTEAGRDEVVVIGGKEFVVTSELLGQNQNSIAVRQNLPQPIN